jgi:hypothetical protein
MCREAPESGHPALGAPEMPSPQVAACLLPGRRLCRERNGAEPCYARGCLPPPEGCAAPASSCIFFRHSCFRWPYLHGRKRSRRTASYASARPLPLCLLTELLPPRLCRPPGVPP